MAKTSSPPSAASLQFLIDQFVKELSAAVEGATMARIQTAIGRAVGNGGGVLPRRRGRPPKNPFLAAVAQAPVRALRAPKQLCPVPDCTNPAAPVFGMVCSEHKDVPKSKIRQYRAARRAEKAKAKGK